MISSTKPIQIPAPISKKLKEVGNEKTKNRMATWFVGGLALLLFAMCLAMYVDWMLTLFSPMWRSVLTIVTLVAVGALQFGWWISFFRRCKPADLATEVDSAMPQLEERWSTIAEIAASPPEHHVQIHRGMMDRLSREAMSWEPLVHPDEIMSSRSLVIAWGILCTMLLMLALALTFDWSGTSVLVRRFWLPTANISATRIIEQSGDVLVGRGESFTLGARLEAHVVPQATLLLSGEKDEMQRITLFAEGDAGDRLTYRVKAADESFDYRLRAGDGQTDWHRVTVVDRPELSGVRFRVIPPDYTKQEQIELKKLPRKVTVVEGSSVEIALRPRGAETRVVLRLVKVRHPNSEELLSREYTLKPDKNGWFHYRFVPSESLTLSPLLRESHGLENRHPPLCKIYVYRDQPPVVSIITPDEDLAIRADESIDVRFKAQDDIAISKAELVVYETDPRTGEPIELDVIAIPLEDQQDGRQVQASVTLDLAKYDLKDGDELDYAVRVYDNHQKSASHSSSAQHLSQHSSKAAESAKRPGADQTTAPNRDMAQNDPSKTAGSAPMQSPSSSQASADPNSAAKGNKATDANKASQSTPKDLASSDPSAKNTPSQMNNKLTQGANAENSTKVSKAESSENQPSSSPGSRMAATSKSKPSEQNEQGKLTGAPKPPDNMPRRMLDLGQCVCSSKKRIHIDRWAGSYAGLQRQKLEIAIAPELQNLDDLLAKAENYSRQVLDRLEQKKKWTGQQDRWLSAAEKILQSTKKNVSELRSKTAETPYAFIGLQLSEIVQSHIAPARESLWSALNADADAIRHRNTQSGWQQIARARQRLRQLTGQFDRIRREHRLADNMIRIKTMYRVFLENSFIALRSGKPVINSFERSMVQFELNEEDLKRIQEVLEMWRDLEAELSRIFSEDPRLLRRFTDRLASRNETLRDQLTLLAQRQQQIDRELRAWIGVDPADREALKLALIRLRLAEAGQIASSAAEFHERFLVWLPLDLDFQDGSLAAVRDSAAGLASDTRALQDAVNSYDGSTTEEQAPGSDLASFARLGRAVHDKLRRLDVQLRRLSAQRNHADLSTHTIRRLAEVSRLITRTSAWVAKIERFDAGKFHRVVEVDQYTLATDTNQLTADLDDSLQCYVDMLGQRDKELHAILTAKARALFSTLDDQIAPNQLAMSFSLNQNKLPKAVDKAKGAIAGFAQAERQLDELMRLIITEMDKWPVQAPTASSLQDPTLDELLAMLEDERDCRAGLGIPCCRPSNLNIVKDWLLPGNSSGSGGSGGSSGKSGSSGDSKEMAERAKMDDAVQRDAMMMAYLRHQQQRANELTQRASARAIARALKESGDLSDSAMRQLTKQATGTDWNVLVSKLEDELLQGRDQLPPEAYRRAIEQYFDEISRTKSTLGQQ